MIAPPAAPPRMASTTRRISASTLVHFITHSLFLVVVVQYDGISILNQVVCDGRATLVEYHGIDQGNHCLSVTEGDFLEGTDADTLANAPYIFASSVLGSRSPSRNNLLYRVQMVMLDVSPQEDEPGAQAVVHAGELLEVLVRRIWDFALPLITYADIKRVAVADTSGNHLLLLEGVTRHGGFALTQCFDNSRTEESL